METNLILDSSILIDYLRKMNKRNAIFHQLARQHQLSVSVITRFELEIGLKSEHQSREYREMMKQIQVLSVDQRSIEHAIQVDIYLKPRNQRIELADLLIAATALAHRLPVATLNAKHFVRIPYLQLVDLATYQP